jgi:uncharacterized protein
VRRIRTVTDPLPDEIAVHDGLSYSLWLPPGGERATAGVVILHGAGSRKENHHDFARALIAAGFAALAFDLRGHGASDGPMDGRAMADVATMADLLRTRLGEPAPPIALRGSSMGGFLAIVSARAARAAAVVAICPASTEGLRRVVLGRRFDFAADAPALTALLDRIDLAATVQSLAVPVLLLHADGDETVPVEHSRYLAEYLRVSGSRLITVPGGHHRHVQHDDELQAATLRWLADRLAG